VTVLATQHLIDALAERIERAYRLRVPYWHAAFLDARVWSTAAARLLSAHAADASIPLDPTLYVTAQPIDSTYPDPWRELTDPEAATRYRRQVAGIVRRLRAELGGEVRRAERRIAAGEPASRVLTAADRRLSPLGRYITARRAGRPALARRFVEGARVQHAACPLYRQASARLLLGDAYPVATTDSTVPIPAGLKGLLHSQASPK
jgi:hypothetical protein